MKTHIPVKVRDEKIAYVIYTHTLIILRSVLHVFCYFYSTRTRYRYLHLYIHDIEILTNSNYKFQTQRTHDDNGHDKTCII